MQHFFNHSGTISKNEKLLEQYFQTFPRKVMMDYLRLTLCLMVERKRKPHTIGEELILPSVKEVLKTILHHKASSSVIKCIF